MEESSPPASGAAMDPKLKQGAGGGARGGGLKLQKSLGSFMAGSAAGMMSTAALQPLEVIKTHMQARDGPHGHSIRGAVKAVAERDGLRGFWRGTGPACVRVGFGAGLYFAMLGPIMSTLQTTSSGLATPLSSAVFTSSANPMQEKMPSASIAASAGVLTRLLASTITCPITVIKTRMEYAAASGLNYSGTASALLSITRTEGLAGLYSGVVPTLVRDAPYSGLYLLLYTRVRYFLRENFSPRSIPQLYINFLSGAFAGCTATLLTHPPDVVRTRLQLERKSSLKILSTVQQIVQVEGLRGLFVGVIPRVGRRGLQQAFSWTIFEEVARLVDGRM
ncbi:unnamed protein product [Calypogeia fissa]